MATLLLSTVVPPTLKMQDYFGELFGNYTSQARFDPSHGEPVKMSCRQKPIFVAEILLPTQHAKHADLMQKQVAMYCGNAKSLKLFGFRLASLFSSMGFSFTLFLTSSGTWCWFNMLGMNFWDSSWLLHGAFGMKETLLEQVGHGRQAITSSRKQRFYLRNSRVLITSSSDPLYHTPSLGLHRTARGTR